MYVVPGGRLDPWCVLVLFACLSDIGFVDCDARVRSCLAARASILQVVAPAEAFRADPSKGDQDSFHRR